MQLSEIGGVPLRLTRVRKERRDAGRLEGQKNFGQPEIFEAHVSDRLKALKVALRAPQ